MSNPWRGVALGLATVLVVGLGIAVAMAIGQGPPSPSIGPSPTIPGTAPTPTFAASPSPGVSAGSSEEPSPSTPPSSPAPSPTGEALASATVRGLKVDAHDDPEGRDRTFAFTTVDPAAVAMRVTLISPRGTVDACLNLNGAELYCTSGRTFTLTGQTSRSNAMWELTLRGQGIETPVLDVTIEFPSAEPVLTIDGAWFDGAARPDHNGIVVELVPRGPLVSIRATWDGSYEYRLTINPPLGSGLVFEGTGSSVNQDVLLAAELHRFELLNTGAGAAQVPFTATIAWR